MPKLECITCMKTFGLLFIFCTLLFACGAPEQRVVAVNHQPAMHFSAGDSVSVDPMTLLHLNNNYYLVYQGADSSKNKEGLYMAASKNLLDWEAAKEINLGGSIHQIKGALIVDSTNSTGLNNDQKPILLAVVVGKNAATESLQPVLAFSNDTARSWSVVTKGLNYPQALLRYPQNVHIVWHANTKKWIMAVALPAHAEFYSSNNLMTWNFESSVGADFFPEEIQWQKACLFPDQDNKHWILLADIKRTGKLPPGGGTVYFAGFFDGKQFSNLSHDLRWLDYGENVYTSLVGISADGRRIGMASKKGEGHQQHFVGIPRQLKLDNSGDDKFMFSTSVNELNARRTKQVALPPLRVSYKNKPAEMAAALKTPFELTLKFNTSAIQKGSFPTKFGVGFYVDGSHKQQFSFVFNRFGYYYIEKPSQEIYPQAAAVKMPFEHADSILQLRIIVDASTIECFAEDGRLVMTGIYSPRHPINALKLFSEKGDIDFLGGSLTELKTTSP